MTDEERQRTMDFIMAQQAQFWASIQKHEESRAIHEKSQGKLEKSQARLAESQEEFEASMNRGYLRVDRLELIVKLMAKAGIRARRRMHEQDESVERGLAALREADARSNKEIETLIASRVNSEWRVNALTESQTDSDKRLDALIDIVREQRNGRA